MTDHPGEAQVWAAHHLELSRSAARLLRSVGDAFLALNGIQYRAPWRTLAEQRRRRGR